MKKPTNLWIKFSKTDFDQPFTNGLCCPLATAIRRQIECKEVNVSVETVVIDKDVYRIYPPFTHNLCQEIKRYHGYYNRQNAFPVLLSKTK